MWIPPIAIVLLGVACDVASSESPRGSAARATCGRLAGDVFVYVLDDARGKAVARLQSELSANEEVVTARLMSKQELHDELSELYEDDELDQALPPVKALRRQIRVHTESPAAAEDVAASVRSSPAVADVALGQPRTC
jgi:cell division protein FtsX